MSLCYDFQKWTMITLASVAISLTIGLISLAYGQELNTTQQDQNNTEIGTLMKYKGQLYCYDETTTTKKEVIEAIKNDWMTEETEIQNELLNFDDETLSLKVCQGMIAEGHFTNEDYNDCIEGKLTLKFK